MPAGASKENTMTMQDSHRYCYGIEEEFFLVNALSRNAVPRVPRRIVQACRSRLGKVVHHELLQSQIEITSPIFFDPIEARETMMNLRQGVAGIAADAGLRIIAAGTHPLARWPEQLHTEQPRYAGIAEDLQIVAHRNFICGLHVHVAVPDHVDRVDLMNRMMPWLPLFLALSTSSPFWDRRLTGFLSYRQAVYDEWPRMGIPDFFANEVEYQAFVDLLVRAGAIKDASYLWWSIRPSHRYPTLELRIADSCTHLEDSLALASLFRCLVRAHVHQPGLGQTRSAFSRRLIEENRWRAKRYGLTSDFISEDSGGALPFAVLLEEFVNIVIRDIDALGCWHALDQIQQIRARGTSAHEQLRIYDSAREAGSGHATALKQVVDWLVASTVPGMPAPMANAHPVAA
jgi:carboxylate-amine ligase